MTISAVSLRLTRIDALHRHELRYLDPSDECYYLGEYGIRQGFRFSPMNDLIFNLKKDPAQRGSPAWRYKLEAIETAAAWLCGSIPRSRLASTTLVPIPPSKHKNDPGHDDRLLRVLEKLQDLVGHSDVRELIVQSGSYEPSHAVSSRPGPDGLRRMYYLNPGCSSPRPRTVTLFVDVITTGAQFRAAKDLLLRSWPDLRIVGLFLARAVRIEPQG